jgi:ABC-2 type transport system ATP-binding protein
VDEARLIFLLRSFIFAMSAIEARDLTKVYRTYRKESGLRGSIKGLVKRRYDETRAADQVSFQIEEGEFVGFLGPNGAGKTTVLKMLSGLLNPTSGDARVLGFVPWERRNEMKRQFSLLMGQKNALWWDLPAQESLELNRAIYGIDRARFNKVVGGLAELLEVTDKMNVMVRELSLGERMKMELISALIHEPRVLFLDEPTIGLDVVSQKRVREFLRIYNEEHPIVTMLTSHYMQDIEELCHRVIIIDHGKIFFDGPLSSIIDRFSGHKILTLTFEKAVTRDFSAFGQVVEQSPVSVQLKVPRAKVTETCRQLLEACDVSDINVQELPVEEVIRQLFGQRKITNQANAGRIEISART